MLLFYTMLSKHFVIPAGKVQVYFSFILCFVACKLAEPEDENLNKQNSWVSFDFVKCQTGAAVCVQLAPLHGRYGGRPYQSPGGHRLHRWFWWRWGWRLWDGWLGTSWASIIQPSQPLWVTESTDITLSSLTELDHINFWCLLWWFCLTGFFFMWPLRVWGV